jgi:hypothetical protein
MIPEKWVPIFRKDHAQTKADRHCARRTTRGQMPGVRALTRKSRREIIAPAFKILEHDPEKCAAVFRKDHAQSKN